MPEQYLKETTVEGRIQTRFNQAQLLHKGFAQPLNVVIIVKTNLRTQAQAHVILFSRDLTLAYTSLIDYDGCSVNSSLTSVTPNSTGAWKTS